MTYLVNAADRATFKRCRRQWDFTASTRRRLQPRTDRVGDLDRAVRDALAVYYFPGMWDWDSAIVLPLVVQALDKSLARQRAAATGEKPLPAQDATEWSALVERAHLLLARYFAWAPTVDHFSPIRVETDFDAIVPDPIDPERGLLAADGADIRYTGRIDLLAIDEHDRYWIVRHRVTAGSLPPVEQLLLDEEAVVACWAWERFYDGMEVAGTIFTELGTAADSPLGPGPSPRALSDHPRGGIPQNEASGGGREVSSLRRMYVKGRPTETVERIRRIDGDGFRRTIIRRGPAEVRAAGQRLAQEALDMVGANVRTYPNPAPEHCSVCAFVAPCVATDDEGADVESILTNGYRERPAGELEMGRLGGSPYGVGRGWMLGRGGRGPSAD